MITLIAVNIEKNTPFISCITLISKEKMLQANTAMIQDMLYLDNLK